MGCRCSLKLYKFDVIIHAGANSMAWYKHPDIFWWNYHTTREILEKCLSVDTRLIYFSSIAAVDPVNYYGWSKRMSRDLILASDVMGQCTVLNPCQVLWQRGRSDRADTLSLSRILRGELDSIFDPWERDYIHVDDVVQMVLKVIDDNLDGEYDLGRGIGVSNKEMFDYARIKNLTLAHPRRQRLSS